MAKEKVFLICPVRNVSLGVLVRITEYVKSLEAQGLEVHWPTRDTTQEDPTGGLNICLQNAQAIADAKTIAYWYDSTSEGSTFDFGGAFMSAMIYGPRKRFIIANPEEIQPTPGKSFQNVLLTLARMFRE